MPSWIVGPTAETRRSPQCLSPFEQPFARYRLPWTVPTLHLTIVCAPLPLEPTTPICGFVARFASPHDDTGLSGIKRIKYRLPPAALRPGSTIFDGRYLAISARRQSSQVLAPLLYASPNPDFGCFACLRNLGCPTTHAAVEDIHAHTIPRVLGLLVPGPKGSLGNNTRAVFLCRQPLGSLICPYIARHPVLCLAWCLLLRLAPPAPILPFFYQRIESFL